MINRRLRQQRSRGYFLGGLAAAPAALVPVRAAETFTLRMSVAPAATSVEGMAALHFASAVGRRSGGRASVEVYPNGQIAKEQEAIDGLSTGVLDLAITVTTFLTPRFPQFALFDTPFLFKDAAAGYRVFDGPIGAELFGLLEPKGVVGLAWASSGFREIETTNRAIVTPDDMKGLRIRIPAGAIFAATFQALGAIPVAIDLAELYTALSQHTVDAEDIPLASVVSGKYYNVVKHVALSNHVLAADAMLMSRRSVDALPRDLQRIVREEGHAFGTFMRALAVQQAASAIQFLRQSGIAITEIQYPAFRKAMDPVYALIQSRLGGNLLDRALRASSG